MDTEPSALGVTAEVMEEDVILISLTYTESHPDREQTFLGIFSTKERAEKAMERHMSNEKQRLPYANISKYNYSFNEAQLDNDCLL